MPIIFDTLDELKAFYKTFHLQGGELPKSKTRSPKAASLKKIEKPAKKEKATSKTKAKAKVKTPKLKTTPVKKKGAAALSQASKPKKAKAVTKKESASTKKESGKRSNSMTAQIIDAIQKHLEKKRSFTANDIYAILAKKDAEINKQSVITSVLKQMNSTFSNVSVTERAGNGPRPVKLYNA
jgi:hypothetical protein